jgi:Super-infection exclusion protein B
MGVSRTYAENATLNLRKAGVRAMQTPKEPLPQRLFTLTWEAVYQWFVIFALAALVTWLSQRKMPSAIAHPAEYWLGTGSIFCATVAAGLSIARAWGWCRSALKWRSFRKHRIARLRTLDSREKELLRSMVAVNRRSSYFNAFDATVLALIGCNVMIWAAAIIPTHRAPARITDWTWDYLHEHPELLD